MNGHEKDRSSDFSARGKLVVAVILLVLFVVLLLQIRVIVSPFLWALVVAYLLSPIVHYLNVRGGLPRLWTVFMLYALTAIVLLAGSRYLYPRIVEDGTVFVEDIPRLEVALVDLVGPRPLGIDIQAVVSQLLRAVSGYTSNTSSASHLLINAFETVLTLFLFLVSTFYLLMDAPRIATSIQNAIPEPYRPELVALGREINRTLKQYVRGELLLFGIMSAATTIGLVALGVPGALFLGLVSGALELLPLIGPWTAGTLAVGVAYFNGGNPFGWGQLAYAGSVAILYFTLRQIEDYFVIPNVLGRAVRLHPLVIIFAVTAGGVIGGLFGLLIAVPVAASMREILTYLYCKLFDLPLTYDIVPTNDGGIIHLTPQPNPGPNEDPLAPAVAAPKTGDAP